MVTTIQRWGNSLAIRIPKAFAVQAQLDEESSVELAIEGDRIVITAARQEWILESLVNKITPSNRHRETDWGERAGVESW
jgi:Growth regulator